MIKSERILEWEEMQFKVNELYNLMMDSPPPSTPDEEQEPITSNPCITCDCGGDAAATTHSSWCRKFGK